MIWPTYMYVVPYDTNSCVVLSCVVYYVTMSDLAFRLSYTLMSMTYTGFHAYLSAWCVCKTSTHNIGFGSRVLEFFFLIQ